ncbi:MAG: hypothetical protein EBS86_01515 [Crocinitomicaceae bacterium]|nr:hypothetical protein [Crocinitomicaceae bacterium]
MRLIIFFLAFLPFFGLSQIPTTTSDGTTLTPGGKFEKFYDHYGNEYNLKDLMIDTVTPSQKSVTYPNECTNSGYFKLYFEEGSGFELPISLHQERRAVLCQLFKELSNFIVPVNPTTSVNIWVRKFEFYNSNAVSSNINALSSGLYSMPMNATSMGGIVDNEIWKTINSGVNSYTNVALPIYSNSTNNTVEPPFYHGIIAFNFSNPAINWHTNLSQTPPSNLFDMYTIGLHEITHSLGFNSLITENGNSQFLASGYNYYTRYDSFLKTSNNGLNLISNLGSCSAMYDYSFNANVPLSILTQTNCSIAPVFTGTVNQTILTNNSFSQGTSLSHFKDVCHTLNGVIDNQVANMYYVMSGVNDPGVMKRFLKPEERSVLCDLGYKVQGVYGSNLNLSYKNYAQSMCSGNGVVGVNDGISNGNYTYVVNQGSSLTFNSTSGSPYNIIANDLGAVSFECPQLVYATSGINITNSIPNTSFTFNTSSTATPGIMLIRYVPISAGGKRGNITYIYVIVNDNTNCTFSSCNMVSNGGFENGNGNCGEFNITNGNMAYCWAGQSGSPDLYKRNCTNATYNVPFINAVSNFDTWNNGISGAPVNDVFGALLKTSLVNGTVYEESFQVKLSSPLQQGVTYKLRFFARLKATNLIPSPTPVGLVVSSSLSYLANAGNLYMSNNPSNYDQEGTTFITINNFQNWQFYEYVFTHDGPSGYYNLMLGLDNEAILSSTQKYVFIDDIQLFPSITAPDLDMPSTFCINQSPYNLLLATNYGTGTFSGNGVTNIGTDYFFNPVTAGVGTHIITYNYTNNLGCVVQDFQTVTVVNSTININASASPQTVCSGGSTTLTASGGVTYNWNPGNSNSNPFVVSNITASTNYTLIATNAAGCQTTIQVPVYVTTASSCCTSPNISIPNNSTSSTYATSYSNLTFEIQGQLTVNSNLSLTGCTLRMAPNAKIIVNTGFTLDLTTCTLYSCSDMWQGIEVSNFGFLKLNNTRIEDAIDAVLSLSDATLNINNCTFNKNKTGIHLENWTSYSGINGTTFDCTSNPLTTLTNYLKAPFANQKSHYGIYLNKMANLTIGGTTANTFQNLEVGIYAQQCTNVTIQRNNFTNINSTCPVSGACTSATLKGWCIYAYGSQNITIGNSTNNVLGNTFTSSFNGIGLEQITAFGIHNNSFSNIFTLPVWNGSSFQYTSTGNCISIYNMSLAVSNNFIQNNTFLDFDRGIYYTNNASNSLTISQNRFSNFNINKSTGVHILDNPVQSFTIRNNIFNVNTYQNGGRAIIVENVNTSFATGQNLSKL